MLVDKAAKNRRRCQDVQVEYVNEKRMVNAETMLRWVMNVDAQEGLECGGEAKTVGRDGRIYNGHYTVEKIVCNGQSNFNVSSFASVNLPSL